MKKIPIKNFRSKIKVFFMFFIIIWGSVFTVLYYRQMFNSFDNTMTSSPVERMLYYYSICREYEYSPLNYLDYYNDLILHCTNISNNFDNVESLISNNDQWVWNYGSSMNESYTLIKDYFKLEGWGILGFDSHSLFRWIRENIVQTEDIHIFNYTLGDYIQSSVETLYRKRGDCEDFSILGCSLFESCGFETMICSIRANDVNITTHNQVYDTFNHAYFYVKENSGFYSQNNYWSFKDSNDTWLLVDIMWSNNFGDSARWMTGFTDRTSRYFEDWSDIIELKEIKSIGVE